MKIAIVSINGLSNAGGVERVAARQVHALEGIGRVRVFSLPRFFWIRKIRNYHIPNAILLATFPLFSSVLARCWAGRKGIVISHGYSSIGLFCTLVFAHGCWPAYIRNTGLPMGIFGCITFVYEFLAAHLARRVVGVSESVVEQWTRYYGLNPAHASVLLNSVDTSVFHPANAEDVLCASEAMNVVFVGRFETGKGVEYLARLHEEIASGEFQVSVCICSPIQPPKQAASKFPLFRFEWGLTPMQLTTEYNRADLFLLPSRYEAFELSSIEALACGTPVLLNDTGSRPTLEQLKCPAVFPIEYASSPLEVLREARKHFRGLSRGAVADWTRDHFSGKDLTERLLELCKTDLCA